MFSAKTKRRLGCASIAIALVFLFFQIPYLIDPGLRDIKIRERIRSLNAADCAEIVKGCERLYRARFEPPSADNNDEMPELLAKLGYKEAIVNVDSVRFVAGAGGFSQVGPITIICWIDPKSNTATGLVLDDGRHFDPRKGGFVR